MHKHRRAALAGRIDDDKAVVVGFLERGGRVRTEIVEEAPEGKHAAVGS
jgi:hypothetical protein